MITNKHDSTTNGSYKVLRGLSSDTKPDAVANGSEFLEMDTGKTYLYDEDGDAWAEQPASGGGGVSVQALTVTANGTYTAPDETAYSPITVNVPDGKSVARSDVNFYDYDGTVVAAYTAADFAGLSAMPENPDHTDEHLVAQGWNWSLADAQTYVASYGKLEIGQMYDTDDGATRIVIELPAPRLSPRLNFGVNGTATIDWGDNNTDTITGTNASTQQYKVHTYATEGTYTISISVSEGGTIVFNGSVVNDTGSYTGGLNLYYVKTVRSVIISNCVSRIGSDAFRSSSLLSVVISPGVSANNYAFGYCSSLPFIVIPDGTTQIYSNQFYRAYSLMRISFPASVTSIGNNAFGQTALVDVTIPDRVTSIGSEAFMSCYALSSVSIPASVTSINSSAFGQIYLGFIKFKSTTPPSLASSTVFSNLLTDCKIYVPSGTLSAYTSATNYPSSSTYTYVEY